VSSILKQNIKDEMKAVGFKETDMNDKLAEALAKAVQKYLNSDVQANVSGGSSNGSHKVVAS